MHAIALSVIAAADHQLSVGSRELRRKADVGAVSVRREPLAISGRGVGPVSGSAELGGHEYAGSA